MAASPDPVRTMAAEQAGQFLSARRTQKHHERIALLYQLKARVAQPEAFITKGGFEIPPEFVSEHGSPSYHPTDPSSLSPWESPDRRRHREEISQGYRNRARTVDEMVGVCAPGVSRGSSAYQSQR